MSHRFKLLCRQADVGIEHFPQMFLDLGIKFRDCLGARKRFPRGAFVKPIDAFCDRTVGPSLKLFVK